MNTTDLISKEAILKSFKNLPERVSIEEVFDKIIYLYKVEVGLAQSIRSEGETLENFREKVKTWESKK